MSETQTKPKRSSAPAEEVGDGNDEARESGPARRRRRHERASDKAKRIGEERLEQAREMAAELRHKKGCPEDGALPGDEDTRVEFFPETKPRSLDLPEEERGKRLIVVRCIECGETEVDDDSSKE